MNISTKFDQDLNSLSGFPARFEQSEYPLVLFTTLQHEIETIQKRVVKWNIGIQKKIAQLQVLPLPMYIQIKNILLLSKIGLGRHDDTHVNVPIITESSRGVMFQLKRPKRLKVEQNFFYQTCKLVNILKIRVRVYCGLKQLLLTKFWLRFGEHNEVDKCTWKIGCDFATNNCRSKTYIWRYNGGTRTQCGNPEAILLLLLH